MRATPTLSKTITMGGSAVRSDDNLIPRGGVGLRSYVRFTSAGSSTGRITFGSITADAEL